MFNATSNLISGLERRADDLGVRASRAPHGRAATIGVDDQGTTVIAGAGVAGPILGRYHLEEEVGRGAAGVVYLGRDAQVRRVVAIKTMASSEEYPAEEFSAAKERFLRAAQTAGRLNHPCIVTVYDAGAEQDRAYVVMEFVKGKDLVPYTKPDNLLPLPVLIGIGARVAQALAYAHRRQVVHGDVKPANVMWEAENDTVKITDFGFARDSDSGKTRPGLMLGTPSYLSPEQLAGKRIEAASDLYSLGVTLYQLACGRLPFEGESMARLAYRIAHEPPFNILRTRPDLPPCLVEAIHRAMMKKPGERFRDGDEMAAALRACAAGGAA